MISNNIKLLKKYKYLLTKQQYKTFKGQILSNDIQGFIRGFNKILETKKCKIV